MLSIQKLTTYIFGCLFFIYTYNTCKAQTTIDITYATDSSFGFCNPPADILLHMEVKSTGFSAGDSMKATIDFGDGTQVSEVSLIYAYSNYFGFYHTYLSSGYYTVQFIATNEYGVSDTITHPGQIFVGTSCSALEGRTYKDNNANCIYDAGDDPIIYGGMLAKDSNDFYYWSPFYPDGMYHINVPSGISCNVYPLIKDGYGFICPSSGVYENKMAPLSNLDFSLSCDPGFDLDGYMVGWNYKPGSIYSGMAIYPYNNKCESYTGTLKLILDPKVSLTYVSKPATTISGDTLIWDPYVFPSTEFPAYQSYITLSTPTDINAQLGDTVCFTMIMSPINGDEVPENNIQTVCYEVKNSCDPNIKDVSPKGVISTVDRLTYTILFQNIGTAPATNVFVLDTLDSNLDVTSFKFIGSSDACDVTFPGSNIVMFYFHNINLPDSNSNEPESHGWLSYSIKPKDNVLLGSTISNSASIYFDFNDPVLTNTVSNTILTVNTPLVNSEDNIHVFPNPASDNLRIESPLLCRNASLILFDIWGNEIISQQINSCNLNLNVATLAQGVYFLSINSSERNVFKKIIIQR